jgi:hypothetical protein
VDNKKQKTVSSYNLFTGIFSFSLEMLFFYSHTELREGVVLRQGLPIFTSLVYNLLCNPSWPQTSAPPVSAS